MPQKKLPIEIYKYSNYREFLLDLFDEWGKSVYKWSYGKFSKEAGFAVSNYLKLVIDGKKNLGDTGINKITGFFKFNKSEIAFFKNLVFFNQAKDDNEREKYFHLIKANPQYSKYHKDEKDLHRFYSKWYNPVIRELVDVNGFKSNAKWISQSLFPKISEVEAERSLKFLLKSGQIAENEEGQILQNESINSTGEEVTSLSVTKYHQEMIQKAKESLENFTQEERNVSSLTMAVSPEIYKKITKEIYEFQEKIIELVTSEENVNQEEVCQLNFQLFPVTKVKSNRGSHE